MVYKTYILTDLYKSHVCNGACIHVPYRQVDQQTETIANLASPIRSIWSILFRAHLQPWALVFLGNHADSDSKHGTDRIQSDFFGSSKSHSTKTVKSNGHASLSLHELNDWCIGQTCGSIICMQTKSKDIHPRWLLIELFKFFRASDCLDQLIYTLYIFDNDPSPPMLISGFRLARHHDSFLLGFHNVRRTKLDEVGTSQCIISTLYLNDQSIFTMLAWTWQPASSEVSCLHACYAVII